MAFGVATNNIFSLLDEENEDPQDLANKVSAHSEKPKGKEESTKPKEVARTAVATGVEARMRGLSTGEGAGRGRGRGPARGGNGGRGRGHYERATGEGEAFDAGSAPAANRGRSGRGGRENGRGGRGGRAPREGQEGRPARRQYDRKDGTGRGNEVEKRGGAGRGNWGADSEEIKEEAENVVGPEETKAAEEEVAAEETPVNTAVPPQEEEEKEMTLDEYEKMLEEKRATLNKPTAKVTKVDPKDFAGMKAYTRKDLEDADELGDELELKNKKQIGGRKSGAVTKEPKAKEFIESNFRVGDDRTNAGFSGRPRGRGGRSGGGAPRGGGGGRDRERDREEHRPPREDRPPRSFNGPRHPGGRTGPAPSINDASAFPTLS